MENNKTTKTALGIDENIEGLLCYVLGFITGIVFLLLEKENKFVRFHAIQSIIVFGGLFILNLIISIVVSVLFIVPYIYWTVGWIVGMLAYLIYLLIFLVSVILWILLMLKAYQGERFKLPIVGDFAEKQISK